MKSKFLALVLALVCAVAASAQNRTPRPSATPPSGETDIVKITTSLIQIDVTATDGKGRVVTDLRPDEIEIFENGAKQSITNFSFVSNARVADTIEEGREKASVVLPPSPVRRERIRRTFSQLRIFRDGKPILEGKLQPVPWVKGDVPNVSNFNSALVLGSDMTPGDYVLEVTITDKLAKSKNDSAVQLVQFELLDR